MHHGPVLCLLLLAWTGPAPAQGDAPQILKPAEIPKAKTLELSPAPAPTPAFQYRLLPGTHELQPGDAAPIYLRIRHELRDVAFNELRVKAPGLLDAPRDQFPLKDARALVDQWRFRYRQIEFGTRRETCNWNYTLREQSEESISIFLPDAQEMRYWTRLVALKARVEIAEGRFDEAARTIETGIALGKHVGAGPFVVNGLIGVAICNLMLNQVEEFISQPGSPNLYWSLTALPSPLVDFRAAVEIEQGLIDRMVPELTDLERPRSEIEWTARLVALHRRLVELAKTLSAEEPKSPQMLAAMTTLPLEKLRQDLLDDAARFALKLQKKTKSARKIGDDQAIVMLIVERCHALRDALFQNAYLPYPQMAARVPQVEAILAEARASDPVSAVVAAIQPTLPPALRAQVLCDRRVAALRVIEALRLRLAATGQFPARLADLSEVPIPSDPATGQPFAYELSASKAILSAPALDGVAGTAMRYELAVRP